MNQLHIFVEELSVKRVLDTLAPKLLPEGTVVRIYAHQGKQDLEKALHSTVPSISKIPGARIIISRDQDTGDCLSIKSKIEAIVRSKISCPYKIRIICTELESWFLGDLKALEKAFTRFKADSIEGKVELRQVDRIVKPSDYLLRVIPEYAKSHYLPKVENANRIAPFMSIHKNRSTSYTHMLAAIQDLMANE